MFKFAKNRRVLWPALINEPADDGTGLINEIEVKVMVELLTETEINNITNELKNGDAKTIVIKYLREKVKGWQGIEDIERGGELEYNAPNLAALVEVPYIRKAFDVALWQASTGAPAKN